MSKIRQLIFSTLVFAVVPPFVLRGASNGIEYTGGTVKTIPENSTGMFNFDDPNFLRFNYGGGAFSLPYEQITATEVTRAEAHHILRKVPVPSLNPGKRKASLALKYKDAAGATGTLNFGLTAGQAEEACDTIAAKKAFAEAASAQQSGDWWGDRFWKTNRNKDAWERHDAQNSQPPQSVPAVTK